MPFRPIKRKHWIAFLTFLGCHYERTKSSHEHWKCPDCNRTITFWTNKKEIEAFHILTNLKSLDKRFEDLVSWIEEQEK